MKIKRSAEIQTLFLAEIRNLRVLSGQKQVISINEKKRSLPKFRHFFWPKSDIYGFFSSQRQVISKKKAFAEIQMLFLAEIRYLCFFSGQKKVISRKKKDYRNSNVFCGRNQKFVFFFRPKTGGLQKKGLRGRLKWFFAGN